MGVCGQRARGALQPLTAAVVLAAAGCGGGIDVDTPTPDATQPPTHTPQPTPTGTATEPPESTIIVDPNGTRDFTTIQAALRAVPSNGTILVNPGIYHENVEIKDLTVRLLSRYGASQTVIDAIGCDGVRCAALTITGSHTTTPEISGFSLINGAGNSCGAEVDAPRCGGGIYISGARPTLKGLVVRDNQADIGGGIFVTAGAEAFATGLWVSGNQALTGGGAALESSELSVVRGRFDGNRASQQGGGLSLSSSEATLRSCLVVDNQADVGGGLNLYRSSVDAAYSTLANNEATILGGGLSVSDEGYMTLVAGIVAGNAAPQGQQAYFGCDSCELEMSFTDVWGQGAPWGGSYSGHIDEGLGQLSGDPLFVGGQDYRLQPKSPCINAGPLSDTDPDDSRADLGAYGSLDAQGWDLDGDGADEARLPNDEGAQSDCDDLDPQVAPGRDEVCDGADNDCDGVLFTGEGDSDGDGYLACEVEAGAAIDCDDQNASANPGGDESFNDGDGYDTDCDGLVDEGTLGGDADGDGYCPGIGVAPKTCATVQALPGDCDDSDPTRSPGLEEVCDGLDNDCDGELPLSEQDRDADGYVGCAPVVPGIDGGDPDDGNNLIHPGASEAPNGRPDNLDNDADGIIDEGTVAYDDDADGFCEGPGPCVESRWQTGDCDDGAACEPGDFTCLEAAARVRPDAVEACDGVDTDCDGQTLGDEEDADADGWRGCAGDCNDANANVHPEAFDGLQNGIDEDCNGVDRGAVGFAPSEEDGPARIAISCSSAPSSRSEWLGAGALLLGLLVSRRRRRISPVAPLSLLAAAGLVGCQSDEFASEDGSGTPIPGLATDTQTDAESDSPTATPTSHATTPTPGASPQPSATQGETPPAPVVYVVDASGAGDFISLIEAVDFAESGAVLKVVEGHYAGPVVIGDKSLDIQATGAAERTIVDATGCQGTYCSAITATGRSSFKIALSGLTLTGGAGGPCPDNSAYRCGGGLLVDGPNARLDKMLVIGNQAERGGGLFLKTASPQPQQATNLSVLGNTASRGAGATLAGGLWTFNRLWIADNQASLRGGGLEVIAGTGSLTASVIADNSAAIGGGLAIAGATVNLSFGVLSINSASLGGGISVGDGGVLSADGVILHRNSADQGAEIDMGCADCAATLRYSSADPLGEPWGGDLSKLDLDTSFSVWDPAFVAQGDYRLAAGSPCIDAGPPDATLMDPDGSRADQGAYGAGSADTWDLDGDGAYQLWLPGEPAGAPWDCDDSDPERSPNQAERCDGIDNDCDGVVPGAEEDADGDGAFVGCGEAPDCDDNDPGVSPGGSEGGEGDGADNDCDGYADEGTTGADDDGDGYCEGVTLDGALVCTDGASVGDCDDSSALRSPGLEEACDGIDNDCDGVRPDGEVDWDLDGYRVCDGDTNDANNTVYPGASETPGGVADSLDNDGDGKIDEGTSGYDDDGDGYCEIAPCAFDAQGGDCDDGARCAPEDLSCLEAAAAANPGEPEVCDGIDTDCDGQVDATERDDDLDGYRVCAGDCDDKDAAKHPGAVDIEGNGEDEDCDGWDKGVVGLGGDDKPTRLALSCDHRAGGGGSLWALSLLALMARRRCRT